IVGKGGLIVGYFPPSARIVGVGGICFKLGRRNVYFYGSSGNKIIALFYGTELILFIDILCDLVDPRGIGAIASVDKGPFGVILGTKTFELVRVPVSSPSDIMDILIDRPHQDLGKIGVRFKIGYLQIIEVHIKTQCAIP